ncbi:MAG: alginate export family protein [Planctomycetes bacterium]|nr:alginate export family protein [Planctomycetota bacterium]
MANFSHTSKLLACVLGTTASMHGLQAAEPVTVGSNVGEALSQGTTSFDLRVRYEHVDQDGTTTDLTGDALTARGILTYRTLSYNDWSMALAFEFNAPISDDSRYNDTVNGQVSNAVIADPQAVGIDEAYLYYDGSERMTLKLGRQVINLDNQRFIGAVEWRQNRQTFDAARIELKLQEKFTLHYLYVYDVQRVFTDNNPSLGTEPMSSHLVNANYTLGESATAVAYGYFLDFDKAGDKGSTKDSATIGGRISGDHNFSENKALSYLAEYAYQSDFADRSGDLSASYMHGKVGLDIAHYSLAVGYELLGSDGGSDAFSTPLATLHKFNGWADKFLSTGSAGLQDLYVSLGAGLASMPGLDTKVIYHQFDQDEGSLSGNELDLQATYELEKIEGMSLGVKAAIYSADGIATDTTKFWLWTSYAF